MANYDLHLGDCLEVMKSIPDASIDCVLTDPPYGTTACKWDSVIPFEPMWKEVKRITKPNAAICLFGSQPFTSALVMSNPKMFRYEWIWNKSRSGAAFTAQFRPIPKHENILVFSAESTYYVPQMRQGEPYQRTRGVRDNCRNEHGLGLGKLPSTTVNNGVRYPDTVLVFGQEWSPQQQIHPTQKPVELLRYLIRTYTQAGETVLDFTMGSGSTGVACALEDRKFVGIEKDAGYFDIAKKRIEGVIAQEPLFTEVTA